MLIQILIPNGGSPTFVWEPKEALILTQQNFDQNCILSLENYSSRNG
jgi:hypothetical protein